MQFVHTHPRLSTHSTKPSNYIMGLRLFFFTFSEQSSILSFELFHAMFIALYARSIIISKYNLSRSPHFSR
jgi:hypothetical protein